MPMLRDKQKRNELRHELYQKLEESGESLPQTVKSLRKMLSKDQTDGLEMTWGNAEAIVEMTKKIAERDGIGDVLADGIKVAWQKMDEIGTEFAVHVNGEEVPAHDPRFVPGLATTYLLDATPGRHTQGGELLSPVNVEPP